MVMGRDRKALGMELEWGVLFLSIVSIPTPQAFTSLWDESGFRHTSVCIRTNSGSPLKQMLFVQPSWCMYVDGGEEKRIGLICGMSTQNHNQMNYYVSLKQERESSSFWTRV